MTKDLRLKIYPAIIAILGLSLVALLLSRIEIQLSSNPVTPADPVPVDEIPPAPSIESPSPAVTESPSPTPSPSPTVSAPPAPVPAPVPPALADQGGLRVSNQTAFPIRIALLPQQPDSASQTSKSAAYSQPVHWDFAPEEGEAKGLILSLPNQTLRLQVGDVLVAFAQDGSRRYWGPYVVGKTAAPTWSTEQKEWLLILQP